MMEKVKKSIDDDVFTDTDNHTFDLSKVLA